MRDTSPKTGYSLVEMMIASAITVVILGGLCGSFLATHRLVALATAEVEYSLAVRNLRDKLLFHAASDSGGAPHVGLLSLTDGTSVTAGDPRIVGTGPRLALLSLTADESDEAIDLNVRQAQAAHAGYTAATYRFANAQDGATAYWLFPMRLGFQEPRVRFGDTASNLYHLDIAYRYHPHYLFLDDDRYDYERAESILVPQPGKTPVPNLDQDTLTL